MLRILQAIAFILIFAIIIHIVVDAVVLSLKAHHVEIPYIDHDDEAQDIQMHRMLIDRMKQHRSSIAERRAAMRRNTRVAEDAEVSALLGTPQMLSLFGAPDESQVGVFGISISYVDPSATAEEHKRQIARRANTRSDAAKIMLTPSFRSTHTPNDHQAVSDLASSINMLKSGQPQGAIEDPIRISASLKEIRDKIRGLDPRDREFALATLETIEKGAQLTSGNIKEDQLLAAVWWRSKHPDNAQNKDNIQTAIIDALIDSAGNGSVPDVVCCTGRCARVVAALATLDYEPAMGNIMTTDTYRTQIFSETRNIIDEELTNHGISGFEPLTTEAENAIRSRINANMRKYVEFLAPTVLKQIHQECESAIML